MPLHGKVDLEAKAAMEVFPAKRELRTGAASNEKRVKFLQEIEAGGWPLVHSLWELSIVSESQCGSVTPTRRFYVDNAEAPNCVMERYPIQQEGEKEVGSESLVNPVDIPYIHMTLCVAPKSSQQEGNVIAAMDAFEDHGALDWGEKLLFPYLNTILLEEVRRRARDQGGEIVSEGLSNTYTFDTSTMAATSEACTSSDGLKLPEGMFVDSLDVDDAGTMNKHWKFGGSTRTLRYIAKNIRISAAGFAVGVYVRKPDGSAVVSRVVTTETEASVLQASAPRQGELVAWGMVSSYGAIGMLQTLPAYQRRGLAQVIIRRLVGALYQQLLPVFAVIEVDNQESKRCFEKAGFGVVPDMEVVWVHYFPPGMKPIPFVNEDFPSREQHVVVVGTCT